MYKIPDTDFQKYNVPQCHEVPLTAPLLDEIREDFQELRGLPAFVDHVLHLKPGSKDVDLLKQHPGTMAWNASGTALIIPDRPYWDSAAKMLPTLKTGEHGLSLNVWYVHPTLLEKSVFSSAEARQDVSKLSNVCYAQSLEGNDPYCREVNRQRIREIEAESVIPYLASPTDLTPLNLEWLKDVRSTVKLHLAKIYDVTENDRTDIFLHKINDRNTATLHFHVRVNQGVHPLEERKRMSLDKIIDGLEYGKTVKDMMIADGPFYPASDELKTRGLKHLEIRKIPNPEYIPANPEYYANRTQKNELGV